VCFLLSTYGRAGMLKAVSMINGHHSNDVTKVRITHGADRGMVRDHEMCPNPISQEPMQGADLA